MAKSNSRSADNLLDLIPVPSVDWGENPDGTVYIIKRKFKSGILIKWLKRFGISDVQRTHLDEFGSYVWKRCDGNRTVHEIGILLQEHFGKNIEPVFERLGAFIKILAHHHHIHYKH